MVSRDERQAQMRARLGVLRARLADIAEELGSHEAQDWEDRATEREGDEVLEGVGLSAQQEVQMIEAALARIDAGEYGLCVRCGDEIGEPRLDVLPFTPFCRSCAAAAGGKPHG